MYLNSIPLRLHHAAGKHGGEIVRSGGEKKFVRRELNSATNEGYVSKHTTCSKTLNINKIVL